MLLIGFKIGDLYLEWHFEPLVAHWPKIYRLFQTIRQLSEPTASN